MSDDIETVILAAVEPIVLELEAARVELGELRAALELLRSTAAASLEALVAANAAAALELEELKRHRLDAPAWSAGVYRQGAVVQHFHGQYFEAAADTAAEPGDGVAWKQLGNHGFRYVGLFIEGTDYETGDLVQRDGGMLLQTQATLAWLVLRGRPGPRGVPGEDGAPGRAGEDGAPGPRGADGATLVELEVADGLIWGVMSDGKRAPIALEAVP